MKKWLILLISSSCLAADSTDLPLGFSAYRSTFYPDFEPGLTRQPGCLASCLSRCRKRDTSVELEESCLEQKNTDSPRYSMISPDKPSCCIIL